MSETTSVPTPIFGPTGYIAPAESAILTGVQADMNTAFGGNLNPALTTPQGQLASSLTAIIADSNNQFLQFTNQVDPAFTSGRMQDAIARIYFLMRDPALPTVVTATITGLAGVVIPFGALAQDTSDNQYICTNQVTIPSSGTITTTFQNTQTGPIPCAAGTLTTIYKAIPGWDSITNAAAGVLGQDVETSQAFEFRRQNSVAANAAGTLPAILGAVLKVPDVLDCYVYDNSTNSPQTVGGVSIAANSLYVCVSGGAAQAVAQAIWSKKAPGCSYTGNTTETVTDPSVNYSTPPSYSVTFETAADTPIYIAVSIANSTTVPSNALALIQAAIISAFAGQDGGTRARIGSKLFALRYYTGIAALGAWAQVVSITIGTAAAPTAADITLNINESPTISASDITLTLV